MTGTSSRACSSVPNGPPAAAALMSMQDERRLLRTLMNMNRDFVKSIDGYALVLVLLATITYPTFSQPPGSFDDDGLMRTSCNPRLTWFVYLNSFSFFFSMTDLLLCLSGKYAPMGHLRKGDRDVEQSDPKSQKQLAEFNDKLAHAVLFTLTKLLVINLLFVVSLTCCIAAYVSGGSAVQQLNISNQLSIIIPCIGGCFLYSVFVIWLFIDFTLFFRFATSGSILDCLSNFGTMIWFFIFLGASSCTQKRFTYLARKLAETARLWRVRQLFNKASDEINSDQIAEPGQQQLQQHLMTETNTAPAFRSVRQSDNNAASSTSAVIFMRSPVLNPVECHQQHPAANAVHQRTASIRNTGLEFPSFFDQISEPPCSKANVVPVQVELGELQAPHVAVDDDKEEEVDDGSEEEDDDGPQEDDGSDSNTGTLGLRCSTCYRFACECGKRLPQLDATSGHM